MSTKTGIFSHGKLRWSTSFIMLISVVIGYFDRLNITFALPKLAREFGWTVEQTGDKGGMLMSIFYAAYGVANILLSPYGEKIGPKRSLLIIICLWSVFTALGAFFGQIFTLFLATRILLGLSEGIHFPMINVIIKNWFPTHERSRGNGMWISGIFVATILAPIVLVPIIEAYGWRTMFYVLSASGVLITFPLVYFFVYDKPEKHPNISDKEQEYIREHQEKDFDKPVPLKVLLQSKVYLLVLLIGVFNNMAAHGLISWLPTYFTEARELPFADLTYAMSLPYAFSIFGIFLWSFIGDYSNRRIIVGAIGFALAGVCTYFAIVAETIPMTIVILSGAVFSVTGFVASEFAIVQRILPKSAVASGVGVYNGVSMLVGGGLGPIIVGQVVRQTSSYANGVLSLVVICGLASITLFILSRYLKY